MPTYVYRCEACGHEFEHFEKMSSRRKTRRCPVCGERSQRQISGGAGFLFKGEGFYITDYRSAEYRKREKSESGKQEPGKKESGGEGREDAKPEKTPPTKKKRDGGAKKKKS